MTEIKFFFWNVQNCDETTLGSVLQEIKNEWNPGIIALAETNISDSFISKTFGAKIKGHVSRVSKKSGNKMHLKIYSNDIGFSLSPHSPYGNGEICTCLLHTNGKDYLVSVVHFLSQMFNKTVDSRFERAIDYRNYFEDLEADPKLKNASSIVFGDFNANPFEKMFTSVKGLFAIDLVKSPPRKLLKYKYFINPTVSQQGHFNYYKTALPKPPGSYHFPKKNVREHNECFWNVFDGLFFRPEVYNNYLAGSELTIITKTKNHNLFDFSSPSLIGGYSDHLPIKFSFKL